MNSFNQHNLLVKNIFNYQLEVFVFEYNFHTTLCIHHLNIRNNYDLNYNAYKYNTL